MALITLNLDTPYSKLNKTSSNLNSGENQIRFHLDMITDIYPLKMCKNLVKRGKSEKKIVEKEVVDGGESHGVACIRGFAKT